MFDWPSFLERNTVPFVRRSPNIGRHQIGVHCPFCGDADQSEHLAISLRGDGWVCRRNRRHSGRSRSRLIQALLHCSPEHARDLAGENVLGSPPADISLPDRLNTLLGVQGRQGAILGGSTMGNILTLPGSFKPLNPGGFGGAFWRYMVDRGYDDAMVTNLTKDYDLRYSIIAEYAYRLIFPVRTERGQLMTWTARSIIPGRQPRYKTLQTTAYGIDGPVALAPPGQLLLGLPLLWASRNPRLLVVCEGPFDAIRVTALGADIGIYGTCLFGLNASKAQAELLRQLANRFPRMCLLLDEDAALMVFQMLCRFEQASLRPARLPDGIKDPGELPTALGRSFLRKLLQDAYRT